MSSYIAFLFGYKILLSLFYLTLLPQVSASAGITASPQVPDIAGR